METEREGPYLLSRIRLKITGVVQGVGFRPYIFRLARSLKLTGYVLNDSRGVEVDAEGTLASLARFLEEVKRNPPPMAKIREICQETLEIKGYADFSIAHSREQSEKTVVISPDFPTCPTCLEEIQTGSDRRFLYPFTNCTACGPRFTIIQDTPYDREKTTMREFEMCPACRKEFHDPESRRFHAQPNACADCGPSLSLFDSQGNPVSTETHGKKASSLPGNLVDRAAQLLREGKILAIKGIGGYHLACDAGNEEAVTRLRLRKHREDRPFALMTGDLETIRLHATVSQAEENLLFGPERPIVLLERQGSTLPEGIAPGQKTLGFMLPYSPHHFLLTKAFQGVLVMTSGNVADEPIAVSTLDARTRLSPLADFFLDHNRNILVRCDDSVARIADNRLLLLRRSRGFVPLPIEVNLPFGEIFLATGGEKKNTFCFGVGKQAYLSHHIGDLENRETLQSFEEGVAHFRNILGVTPQVIACDLHPGYASTYFAAKQGDIPVIPVQHHHAHVVSCMTDNQLSGDVIGIAFDGTGYGSDGRIWGGEILIANEKEFQRFAHLNYVPLPGGEKAAQEPWRMAFSWLFETFGDGLDDLQLPVLKHIPPTSLAFLKQMVRQKIASPLTSSVGRLFDAVAAICDIRVQNHYEGQAAIELEFASRNGAAEPYPWEITPGADILSAAGKEPLKIDLRPAIAALVQDRIAGVAIEDIGARFHQTVAHAAIDVCKLIKAQTGLNRVVLSGGVFQNMILLESMLSSLRREGFEAFSHSRVPPNDGGLSLGQAIIARAARTQG